jgi:hypothetical protein
MLCNIRVTMNRHFSKTTPTHFLVTGLFFALTACGGVTTSPKPETIVLSQQVEGEEIFKKDAFVLTEKECPQVLPRWGYLPKGNQSTFALEELFKAQEHPLKLTEITLEISKKKSSLTDVPREYRVLSARLPAEVFASATTTAPGVGLGDSNDAAKKHAKAQIFEFKEVCASKKNLTFNQKNLKTSFPSEFELRGNYTRKIQLLHDLKKENGFPELFSLLKTAERSFAPEMNGAKETLWDSRLAFYSDSGLIIQYARRRMELLKDSDLKEGDERAKKEEESQLTLTLLYRMDPFAPRDSEQPSWLDQKSLPEAMRP